MKAFGPMIGDLGGLVMCLYCTKYLPEEFYQVRMAQIGGINLERRPHNEGL